MTRYMTTILLLLLFCASAPGEEQPRYSVGHKITESQLLTYEVKDTKKTLVTEPQTQQAVIVTLTSTLDAKRLVYARQGIWMRTVENSPMTGL